MMGAKFQIEKILTFLNLPNIGNAKAKRLSTAIEAEVDINEFSKMLINETGLNFSESEINNANYQAKKIIETCNEHNIKILIGEEIPPNLSKYKDSPLVIFSYGDLPEKNEIIAIIGSRTPSKEGISAAQIISDYVSKNEYIILSGLAIGVDTIAHQTAVKNNKKTIAVLGSGILNIYPKENKQLAHEIVECGGCLVSAYSPETPVQNFQLIARDKLQARLSNKIILVESKKGGGSMHAMKEAAAINIPSFSIEYPDCSIINWEGNHELIKSKQSIAINNIGLEKNIALIKNSLNSQDTLF